MIRSYSELRRIETFEERFRYLMLRSHVGTSTFGFDRWINQSFYRSSEWRHARNFVIDRDMGCDLGILGYEINSQLLIHHMNPLSPQDIVHGDPAIIDPDYLITTTHRTHNAIHYGDEKLLAKPYLERSMGDTKLW